MILESTIQQVKDSVVTHEVVGSVISLKKKGIDYTALCPFHTERTPSFSVSPAKNIYKCFGCGKSGDGITFLMDHQKLSFIEAIRWIAEKNNIQLEETVSKKNIIKPQPRLEKLSPDFIEYFEKRGISNNTLLRFKVTESLEWMPKAKKEVRAVCFNYFKDDEVINIKFRASNKDFKLSKDSELIFYNLDSIKDEDIVCITEGEIDAMSVFESGFYNVISVPNGAAANGSNQRLEYLDNCWNYFTNKKKVILFTDNDTAGQKLKEELARRIGYAKCYLVEYPEGCKDANDILIKLGKNAIINIIENAKLFPLEGEITMDDMFETVMDFYENGYPQGFESGVSKKFDDHFKFYPGQLTMVTGIPGSGKSEFIDWLMTSLSRRHEWNWGICSFECPPEFHVTKLAEKFSDKAFAFRKDPSFRISPNQLSESIGMIDKHFHFMNLNLIDVTIDGLILKAEEFVIRYGINGFLFDPWNCIEAKGEGTDYILQCLNKLINFLKKYKVHGFLVAHPTKLQKDKQTGKYEVPTLYSISGSAHFFNRTDNGMSVYRDFETGVVDVHIQKIKQYWLGKIGFCSFKYDTDTRSYSSID